MKKIVLMFLLLVSNIIGIFAQEVETAIPLFKTEVVRKVAILDMEGKYYSDVVMTFKSTSPTLFGKVKVTARNSEGKIIWKKTLKDVFLYVFSDGHIRVGQWNYTKIMVMKSNKDGSFFSIVREKEGIY